MCVVYDDITNVPQHDSSSCVMKQTNGKLLTVRGCGLNTMHEETQKKNRGSIWDWSALGQRSQLPPIQIWRYPTLFRSDLWIWIPLNEIWPSGFLTHPKQDVLKTAKLLMHNETKVIDVGKHLMTNSVHQLVCHCMWHTAAQFTQQNQLKWVLRTVTVCVDCQMEKLTEAIEDCTKAIELDDKYVKAYLRRAKWYVMQCSFCCSFFRIAYIHL